MQHVVGKECEIDVANGLMAAEGRGCPPCSLNGISYIFISIKE